MRTLRRTLFIVLVLALPMTMAATALGKPSKPPKPPADPIGGYTCAESGYDQASLEVSHGLTWSYNEDGLSGFRFTLTGKSDGMCVDVPPGDPSASDWDPTATAGVWKVKVTDYQGPVLRLLLVPRDSFSPGDSCGGADLRQPDLGLTYELPLPVDPRHEAGIPAATVNACGTQFAEFIDGELVVDQTGDPHPLVFQALMSGLKGTEVTITVTLP